MTTAATSSIFARARLFGVVATFATACTSSGPAPTDEVALASSAAIARPSPLPFGPSRYGEHGFGFGRRGIPGGHGFRGHGPRGATCGAGEHGGGGGIAGRGGMTGGAGGTLGTGGEGGAPGAMVCNGSPPTSPVITDFSDALSTPSDILFGTAPNLGGGTFTYAAPGLTPPALSLVPAPPGSTGQGLAVSESTGTPTDPQNAYSGFGLGFDMCVDASAYTGIQFTIGGNIGNCALTFAAQFSEDNSVTDNPMFGSCTSASCFPPSSAPFGLGTTTVDFADVFGGSPDMVVDARALTAVQWNFAPTDGVSACTAELVVTNIEFVTAASGGQSGGGGGGTNGGAGTGKGGAPGAGGQGMGGAGGPPSVCIGSPPNVAAITDSASSPVGGTFVFSAPTLAEPSVVPTFAQDGSIASLEVSAAPGVSTDPFNAYSGLGLYFARPSCVDAAAYRGITFLVSGSLGTCTLNTFAVTNEDSTVANGGTCELASCVSPYSRPLAIGPNTVLFSELSGGTPDISVDATALNGVGWTLNVPTDGTTTPCRAKFAISDVAFVK
jgi:hypothetical protein